MKSIRVYDPCSLWTNPSVLLCPNICSQGNICYCITLKVLKGSVQIYCRYSSVLIYSKLLIFLVKIKLAITDSFGEVGHATGNRPIPFPD